MAATWAHIRLATVRLGAGSGVRCLNLNLHLQVRFRHPAKPEHKQKVQVQKVRFRFAPGSMSKKCYILLKKIFFYKTFSFDIPKKGNTVTYITNNYYTERQPTTPRYTIYKLWDDEWWDDEGQMTCNVVWSMVTFLFLLYLFA